MCNNPYLLIKYILKKKKKEQEYIPEAAVILIYTLLLKHVRVLVIFPTTVHLHLLGHT